MLRLPDRFRILVETVHRTTGPTAAGEGDDSNLIRSRSRPSAATWSSSMHSFLLIAQMLGAVTVGLAARARAAPTFRWTSMVNQIDLVGWRAVPIILLITFLIGAILAQQGIFHFRSFGADILSSTWSAFWCCAKSAC